MQKLTAIESLAGDDMLCSDKMGMLTVNKLTVNEPYVSPGAFNVLDPVYSGDDYCYCCRRRQHDRGGLRVLAQRQVARPDR